MMPRPSPQVLVYFRASRGVWAVLRGPDGAPGTMTRQDLAAWRRAHPEDLVIADREHEP